MIWNYFKIAFRNIKRQKIYAIINILGLAIGLASFVLIMLWVADELSYEKQHGNADNLYLIHKRVMTGTSENINFSTPMLLAPTARDEIPEVIESCRIANIGAFVTYEDKQYTEDYVGGVDSTYFLMFSFDFILGNPATALDEINSVVITESIATKYFGDEDPIGKVLTFNREDQYKVTAVIGDIERNTLFDNNILIPIESVYGDSEDAADWYSHFIQSYVMVPESVSKDTLDKRVTEHIRKYMSEESQIQLLCQPISRLHLYSLDGKNERIQYVYIFSLIGLLTLLIACINYMNISTSLSVRRSREIGLKKVVGAVRPQLIKQFLGESFIQAFFAMLLAMMLVELLRPYFNDLTNKTIFIPYLSYWFLPLLLGLVIITTLIAGSYPAFLLSSFKPVAVFKGKFTAGKGQANFRRILVIIQFAISIGLIISSLMIYSQLRFVNNKNLGFDKENVIYMSQVGNLSEKYEAFRNELLTRPGVGNVCRTSSTPAAIWSIIRGLEWEGKENDDNVSFSFAAIDFDYLETMGMDLVEGRNFSREFGTDSNNYIFNETAIKLMGFEDNPVGRTFGLDSDYLGKIIGVVKDFNSLPLTHEIEPLMMIIYPDFYRLVMIRIEPENTQTTLAGIEEVWNDHMPDFPFEYNFLDQRLERMYRNESRIGSLALAFTILAILITCIGLFGLASHTAQQKTREIGIRKVFGATVNSVIYLFVKSFAIWVLLANIIAWPLAYYFINDWLKNFAYRVDINWLIFIYSALAALGIAILTVAYQSFVAARKNPVDAIRYE